MRLHSGFLLFVFQVFTPDLLKPQISLERNWANRSLRQCDLTVLEGGLNFDTPIVCIFRYFLTSLKYQCAASRASAKAGVANALTVNELGDEHITIFEQRGNFC